MEPPVYEPPPESTPESLYEELVFRPVFEDYGRKLDEANLTPSQRAEVYQKALLRGFAGQIQRPVLKKLLGDSFYRANQRTKKEVMETPEFQQACEKKVREVAAVEPEVYFTRAMIDVEIDHVKGTQK